jgi:hypothetical protein
VDDLIDAMNLEAEEEGGGTAWLVNPEENNTNFSVVNESFLTKFVKLSLQYPPLVLLIKN